MEFSKPQKYTTRVSDKYFVSENERFLYLKLELVLPDLVKYLAGQYVSVKVNELGERRSYSIATTPDDNHGVHLLAEMIENGKGSKYLQQINPGEVVEFLGPLGRFVVSEKSEMNRLFVATGSGIVPIISMINDLLINKKEQKQIRLNWGMRNEADLFFVDNLERLAEEHPNFVFDIVLSKPGTDWDLCTGHVQDCLKRDFPIKSGGLEGWEAYVCGNPEIVTELCGELELLGVHKEDIYHEKFT